MLMTLASCTTSRFCGLRIGLTMDSYGGISIQVHSQIHESQGFVFGGCYCPFCVQNVWQQHTHYHREQFPLAVEAVQNKCYRENLMLSMKSIEEAKAIWEKITELEDLARLNVGEWISHQPKVIQDIPEQKDSYSNEKDITVQMFIQMFVCLRPIQI